MNIYNDVLVVESIKNSATRTGIIVSHVRTMLEIFEVCCEKSSNELDKRRYDIIYGLYISEDKISRKELAEKWNVSNDTTYIDRENCSRKTVGTYFWGGWLDITINPPFQKSFG